MTGLTAGAGEPTRLPPAVRQRVVAWAADALGRLPADQVPTPLRAVSRFAPARRAKAGASALAATLESDPAFRQRVAASVRQAVPELVGALDAGTAPAAADPVDVAAVAYLVRPDGWAAVLAAAGQDLDDAGRAAELTALEADRARLAQELAAARADATRAAAAAQEQADRLKAELAEARRRSRELDAELGRSRAAVDALQRTARQAGEAALAQDTAAAAELRRLRARVGELESSLEGVRRAAREGRSNDDVRLRLLLDTLLGAAQGLRQELALPPAPTGSAAALPADGVAADARAGGLAVTGGVAGVGDVPTRALAADDPAVLEQLLALPRVHLVVDGYNVTKSGYGTLPLEQQRARLLSGLAALAARTRAEVTCVFDGTTLGVPVLAAPPRGVRVLFSVEGQTADELIDRLVRAEPPGRAVVVVSTDREVADRAAEAGARAVPSSALLRRLDRA